MPDVHVTLNCTLKDFYCGARKQVHYERQVVGLDGRTVRTERCSHEVFVRAGMKVGTEFKCAGKGNETPRRAPSDLYIKLVETVDPNSPFKRVNENDLVYTHKVALVDVLRCHPVNLVTFDDRKLLVSLDSCTSPAYAKVVPNEGMPIYGGLDGGE